MTSGTGGWREGPEIRLPRARAFVKARFLAGDAGHTLPIVLSAEEGLPSAHLPICLLPSAHCIKTLSLSCTFWQTMRLMIISGIAFVKGGLAYHEEVFV